MEHEEKNAHQEYTDMNCVQTDFLLLEGCKRVYETTALDKSVTYHNMIPLEPQFDLPIAAKQFTEKLEGLNKQTLTSFDIWRIGFLYRWKSTLKVMLAYLMSELSAIIYALIVLYLLDWLGHINSSTLFWPYFGICAAFIYDTAVVGVGYREVIMTSNKMKATIFLALYNRILLINPMLLKRDYEGKVLNALTEFHSILESKGHFVFRGIIAPISIIGISILMVIRLGWWSLIGILCLGIFSIFQFLIAKLNSSHLGQLGQYKDERMELLSQILTNFKYIKMQLWERLFLKKVIRLRDKQKWQFLKYGAGLGLINIGSGAHLFSIYVTLMLVHKFEHRPFSIEFILEVVILIALLKKTLFFLSNGINTFFQIDVLFSRVALIFNAQFNPQPSQINNPHSELFGNSSRSSIISSQRRMLEIRDASFSFQTASGSKNVFSDVNLKINSQDFVVIIGDVGSGKTTLLDCIASQLVLDSGQINVKNRFSYLEQELVVFSGTVQENIILEKKMDKKYYKKVIEWCCLKDDFDNFENGDMTFISQKSTNVSGGQKARIALARALYARNKLILLDDPLSSLDINVAQVVFHNLQKLCKEEGFTVIMTLHQTYFINQSNRILHLDQGMLSELQGIRQIQRLKHSFSLKGEQSYEQSKIKEESISIFQTPEPSRRVTPHISRINPSYLTNIDSYLQGSDQQQLQSFENEEVSFDFISSFVKYFLQSKLNYLLFPLTLLFYIISQGLAIFTIYLLTIYNTSAAIPLLGGDKRNFFHVLSLLIGIYFIFMWLRVFFFNLCIQMSNQQLFKRALINLMYSSLKSFKGQGSGDTLDKFSIDLGVLDVDLTNNAEQILLNLFRCTVQFVFITIIFPFTIAFIILMILAAYFLHVNFAKVVIPEGKISLALKSAPLLSQFEETMKGMKTIKTYMLQKWMKLKMEKRLIKAIRSSIGAYKVLATYVTLSRHAFSLLQIILFVIMIHQSSKKTASDFLYSITMLWDLNQTFYWIPGITLIVNSSFISYQRIKMFTSKKANFVEKVNLENMFQESQKLQNSRRNPFSIELKNLVLKYTEDGPPALKNIDIKIKKGKKIAVVGRTGSGKSSLVQALYRIVEPDSQSTYLLNGRDALTLPLSELRQQFCCIPQFPYIFNDTIRKNIDPFDKSSDEDVKRVLKSVGMYQKIAKTPKGLLSSIENKDINLSYGQAQLMCLARMLLEKKSIVIMDEANSGIDENSDEIINEVIRTECREQTVITIAHKLLSIIDYDEILVLRNGEIMERGNARELFMKNGIFYSMVAQNQVVLQKVKDFLKI